MEIKNLLNDNIAFHCDVEEKANEFIKKAFSLGYKWCSDGKDNNTYFYIHTKFTCYKLHYDKTISFGCMNFFKENGYKIIEYELDSILTPIKYLMRYIGIEENEKFNIIFDDGSKSEYNPYTFSNGILKDKDGDESLNKLLELIRGKATIEILPPLKPLHGDTVYYIDTAGIVQRSSYYDSSNSYHLAMFKCGWLFTTQEEAEENRKRILEEYAEAKKINHFYNNYDENYEKLIDSF